MIKTDVTPATQRQLNYIRDIAKALPNWPDLVEGPEQETVLDVLDRKFVSFQEARAALDVLVPLLRAAKTAPCPPRQRTGGSDWQDLQATLAKIHPGKYALPRRDGKAVDFFEVVERKNGVRYLNQLLGGGQGGSKFNRKHLSNQLQACAARHILEDLVGAAKLFAVMTKTCPRCFTALTHPRSIKAGIGHDCATAWGWSW